MHKLIKHIREIILFALPVIAGEVGQILFGIGDVLVAGRYSTVVLAALGVACGFFFPFMIFGMGVIYAVSPLKAKYMGEKQPLDKFVGTSLSVALSLGTVLTVVVLLATQFIVPLIGLKPEVEPLVQVYLRICSVSIIPALMFAAVKENLLAYEKTLFPNALILGFNVFNIGANILFMFTFGLGIAGAAIATLLSRSLMALVLFAYAYHRMHFRLRFCAQIMKRIFINGIPIALNILVTAFVFSLVTVLVGRMSVLASATNNILIQVTSLTYMVPSSLASVVAVKVGKAYGSRNYHLIKQYSIATICVAVSFAALMATVLYLFPRFIMRLITDDYAVVENGVTLLLYIAVYQIPDSIQATVLGCLRGIGETKVPMIIGSISIWLFGMPTGCYLAYGRNMGAAGLWAGLATGLAVMGMFLSIYFIKRLRGGFAHQSAVNS